MRDDPWRDQQRWWHLGGCTDLAIMAGSGAPCPERKLKSTPDRLTSGLSTPGCRSDTGHGLDKPKPSEPNP